MTAILLAFCTGVFIGSLAGIFAVGLCQSAYDEDESDYEVDIEKALQRSGAWDVDDAKKTP